MYIIILIRNLFVQQFLNLRSIFVRKHYVKFGDFESRRIRLIPNVERVHINVKADNFLKQLFYQ